MKQNKAEKVGSPYLMAGTLKTGLVAKAIKAGKTVDEKTLQHFYETEKVSAIETVGLSDAKTPHSSRTP
ncbi:hypothetical protein V6Z98_000555 [Aspergillus fumigatus]